jgi:hypothetical protein
MTTITQIAQALQTVLTTQADELAKESGFIQRQRNLKGSTYAQALIFGWLGDAQSSMEGLSQSAANVGVTITRQALDERFTQRSAHFLQRLVQAGLEQMLQSTSFNCAVMERFKGVYLLDSTVIELPSALQGEWASCNGAGLKLSVCWNLQQGELQQVHLHAARDHDQQAPLQQMPLPAGALRLSDLGYFHLDTFAQLHQQGTFWLTRYKVRTTLYDASGQPFDLWDWLAHQQPLSVCHVQLGKHHRLPCRLVAVRLPQEAWKQREWERKKQRRASPLRWALAQWNIYVTNVPEPLLAPSEVVEVVRLRWQIELLFKLWKSVGQVDEWRTHNPWRILTELYAKLFAMLIQHWLLLLGHGHHLDKSFHHMAQTIRKKAWHLACVLTRWDDLLFCLHSIQRCLLTGCRVSRSRSSMPSFQRLQSLS